MASDQWFVDADSGNDTTGDGSAGNPYLTLNKVFTAKTINANGTEIMLKTGTTTAYVVPSGGLDLTSFGTPNYTFNVLTIMGWDGGTAAADHHKLLATFAEIDLAGDSLFGSSLFWGVRLLNLSIHGDGSATQLVRIHHYGGMYNCEMYIDGTDTTCDLYRGGNQGWLHHCYFHDFGNHAINFLGQNGGDVYRCLFVDETGSYGSRTPGIYIYGGSVIESSVFVVESAAGQPGNEVIRPRLSCSIRNNAFFHSVGGGTTRFIKPYPNGGASYLITDNLYEGMSGTGGECIDTSGDPILIAAGDVMADDTTAYITTGSAEDNLIVVDPDEVVAPLWKSAGTLDFTPNDLDSIRQGTYFPNIGGHAVSGPITYGWKGAVEPKEKLPFHGAAGSLDGI